MPLFLSIYFFSLVGFFIHLYSLMPQERTTPKVIELLLLYQLVFNVGITSFFAFFGFTFMPEYIAQYLGWPACPFEQELANVNLAFGVLGILCIWIRDHFWTATILGFSIWIFSDGIHHIWHILFHNNYSPGNTGVPLVTDIVIPIILVILLVLRLRNPTVDRFSK
jgi:hypothetical protein